MLDSKDMRMKQVVMVPALSPCVAPILATMATVHKPMGLGKRQTGIYRKSIVFTPFLKSSSAEVTL
jgi:hypothetical protein